jgi:hypothetical protein
MSSTTSLARTGLVVLAVATLPTSAGWAQELSCPAGTKCSTNTIVRNIPLPNFKEDDIGLIVDLVIDICNRSDFTHLADGPYRRISNAPGPNPLPGAPGGFSEGDATHDLIVWDSKNSIRGGNIPAKVAVSAADIASQIGISPGAPVTADVTLNSATLTIMDTTGVGGSSPSPFVPGQLIDAGPGIGGLDAAVTIKNGTPKTADLICDQNMYFLSGANVVYGFTGFDVSAQPVNRLLLFWSAGPSAMGTMTAINAACIAFNPADGVPAVMDPNAPDPRSYANTSLVRQNETVAFPGRGVREFGDPSLPTSLTSCNGVAAYCDETEPTPLVAGQSGNACNRNLGFSSARSPFDDALNALNPSYTSTSGGSTTFSNFTRCPYPGYPTCP